MEILLATMHNSLTRGGFQLRWTETPCTHRGFSWQMQVILRCHVSSHPNNVIAHMSLLQQKVKPCMCMHRKLCPPHCNLLLLPDHDNKLTGPDAVKFFERSQLPRPLLAKVWALADSARKGYLDPSTFAKVAKAVAHMQAPLHSMYCNSMHEAAQLAAHVMSRADGVACELSMPACDINQQMRCTVVLPCSP